MEVDHPPRTVWYINAIIGMSIAGLLLIVTVVVETKYSPTKLYNRLTIVPFYALIAFLFFLLIQQVSYVLLMQKNYPLLLVTELSKTLKALAVFLVGSSQALEWICLSMLLRF